MGGYSAAQSQARRLSRLFGCSLGRVHLQFLSVDHRRFVITDDAFQGTDGEQRALLASDGKSNGTQCHDGPRRKNGLGASIVRLLPIGVLTVRAVVLLYDSVLGIATRQSRKAAVCMRIPTMANHSADDALIRLP